MAQNALNYIEFGTAGRRARAVRRIRFINVLALLTVLNVAAFSVLFALSGAPGSLSFVTLELSLAAATLCTPLLSNFHERAGIFFYVFVWTLGIGAMTWGLGAASGMHIYYWNIIGGLPLFFGYKRIKISALLAVAVFVIFLLCDLFFLEPALMTLSSDQLKFVRYAISGSSILILFAGIFIIIGLAETTEDALEVEHNRSEALLYNLLPEKIALRLKQEPKKIIADDLPEVAILFADIAGFTPRAASLPPDEVVGFLSRVFSAFDSLAEKHKLEKIKTIGDAYMVAAGLPNPCPNPVQRVAEMALDMQSSAELLAYQFPEGLTIRIGIHVGPAVAGVIGTKKLFYDVWGQTVNTASRMESHGEPGRIQVTRSVYDALSNEYALEERGTVSIKGMGVVTTWWLTGRRNSSQDQRDLT